MAKNATKFAVAALGLVLAAVLVFAFRAGLKEREAEAEREKPIKAPLRVSREPAGPTVTVSLETQKMSGIEVAPLLKTTRPEETRAYGEALDPQELSDQIARLQDARAEWLKAQAAQRASRAEYRRQLQLFAADSNTSAREEEAARAASEADAAGAEAARLRLDAETKAVGRLWGDTIAAWVRDGSGTLDRIMRRDLVLVRVTVSQDTRQNPPAEISIATGGTESIPATFVSASPRADPKLQGASYFYLAPGHARLVPGLSVSAALPRPETAAGVVVPADAVVWWQGKAWAYVQATDVKFVRREVPTDLAVPGGYLAVSGFQDGERVVVRGAQLYLSEELRSQIEVGEEGESR